MPENQENLFLKDANCPILDMVSNQIDKVCFCMENEMIESEYAYVKLLTIKRSCDLLRKKPIEQTFSEVRDYAPAPTLDAMELRIELFELDEMIDHKDFGIAINDQYLLRHLKICIFEAKIALLAHLI